MQKAARPLRSYGFPYRAPNVPKGVEVPAKPSKLGANYDTEWARTPAARAVRGLITEGPLRLLVAGLANPEVTGLDRLADLMRLDEPPPVIFAPNHHSHVDTGADDPVDSDVLASRAGRRCRGRLLLRQAVEGSGVRAVAQRDPDRPRGHRSQVERHVPRPRRRRPQPADLPRGWPLTRRLGSGVQGRRGVPVGTHRCAGRAGVHRRHRRDLRQGHEAPEAGPHPRDLRLRRSGLQKARTPAASTRASRRR